MSMDIDRATCGEKLSLIIVLCTAASGCLSWMRSCTVFSGIMWITAHGGIANRTSVVTSNAASRSLHTFKGNTRKISPSSHSWQIFLSHFRQKNSAKYSWKDTCRRSRMLWKEPRQHRVYAPTHSRQWLHDNLISH